MGERLVTIAQFDTAVEAYVARARLEEEGIACVTEDEETVTLFGSIFTRVKLKVAESQMDKAIDILDSIPRRRPMDEEDAQ